MVPFTVRLSELKSGHTTSCGCAKRAAFHEFWTSRVSAMPIKTIRAIFRTILKNGSTPAAFAFTAAKFNISLYAIRPALERAKRWLEATYGAAFENSFNPSFGTKEKLYKQERDYLRAKVRFKSVPAEPLVIDWADWADLDEFQQEKFAVFAKAA
jgi:hypothetical protein